MKLSIFHPVVRACMVLLSVPLLLSGCKNPSNSQTPVTVVPVTTAQFAVMSDLHYYDPALGTSSDAFNTYLANDRKMIAQSKDLVTAAVSDILAQKPSFLLISGDLTKDGEKQNHQALAALLGTLTSAGIKVFVVPGNHDINNPNSLSYPGTGATSPVSISNITPADFKTIYANCGYSSAIAQDPNSLSYVAEPVTGLWLIAIDSCNYANNSTNIDPSTGKPTSVTKGTISAATETWINTQLAAAKAQGKIAIGMMHHGLLEHFPGQATLFNEYVVTNYSALSKEFSDNGMKAVFTGHYHANDIVYKDFSSSVLYDVETGSLVTAPSPYRFGTVDLAANTLKITTSRITANIASMPNTYTNFVSFAQNDLYNGLATPSGAGLIQKMLMAPIAYGGFGLSQSTADTLAPLLAYAMMSHYYGDENAFTNTAASSQVYLTVSSNKVPLATVAQQTYTALNDTTDPGSTFRNIIGGMFVDTKPADNNLTFTLGTTTYTAN